MMAIEGPGPTACHTCIQRGIAITRSKAEISRLARLMSSASAAGRSLDGLRAQLVEAKARIADEEATLEQHQSTCEPTP